jgi:MFS family permease
MTTNGHSPIFPAGGAVGLVATLVAIYVISQFLRNSVAVIAPDLAAELQLSAADLGLLSSAFFLAFAAAQIPVGIALDRFGPRWCLLAGVAIMVIGEAAFAMATSSAQLIASRALLGLGASTALVAPLAIYAKRFPPTRFATLTGLQIGLGSVGALIATAPLAYGTEAIGWRNCFLLVGFLTVLMGLLIAVVVRDPVDPAGSSGKRESLRESISGVLAVIRTPSAGYLFAMQMVGYSSFGLVAGLWGGPYLSDVYGYGLVARGDFLLILASAQIVGMMTWGPSERLFNGYKWPVLVGALLTAAILGFIAIVGTLRPVWLALWFGALGLTSAYIPVLIAHGKSLFPPHLVGRGITLFNMGTMGGVFVAQMLSGLIINQFPEGSDGSYPLAAYRLVFGLQAALILLASIGYFRTRDPKAT